MQNKKRKKRSKFLKILHWVLEELFSSNHISLPFANFLFLGAIMQAHCLWALWARYRKCFLGLFYSTCQRSCNYWLCEILPWIFAQSTSLISGSLSWPHNIMINWEITRQGWPKTEIYTRLSSGLKLLPVYVRRFPIDLPRAFIIDL